MKEKKSQDNQTKIFLGGKVRHLTDLGLIDKIQKDEQRKEEEKAEKVKRKTTREVAKAAKDAVEVEWKRMLEGHEARVESWKVECATLALECVPKSQHPKKPTHPRKPKPAISADPEVPGEAQSDDGDVGNEFGGKHDGITD